MKHKSAAIIGIAWLATGITPFAMAQTYFSENFAYGDPSGSLLTSNFHGWYTGKASSTNGAKSSVVFRTGSVPGFSTNGYATWEAGGNDWTYVFAGKLLSAPVSNQTVTLEFKIRTGSFIDLWYYSQGIELPFDLALDGVDAGRINWTQAHNQPAAALLNGATTNIISHTGHLNPRPGIHFGYAPTTTYNVIYSMNLTNHMARLGVRVYDDNTSTWGGYQAIHDWMYAPQSYANTNISTINGISIDLPHNYAGAAMKISDIQLYAGAGIPEPSSLLMTLAGIIGISRFARRRINPHSKKKLRAMKASGLIVIGVIAGMAFAIVPGAKAVTISSSDGTNGTFSVSGTDLINTGQVSYLSLVQGSGSALFGSSPSKLNDGNIYAPDNAGVTYQSFAPSSGSVVTVTLDTSAGEKTNGYAITHLESLTGYAGGLSSNRLGQFYILEFSYIGSAAFSVITNVAIPHPDHDFWELHVALTNFGSAGNAVDQIRFTFNYPPDSGLPEPVYREIDVFGQVIPEPSSLLLIAAGCAGLALVRRRK